MSARTIENLIGGDWTGARSGTTRTRLNPADTDEAVVTYPAMDAEDAEVALQAASAAARDWGRAGPYARGRVLLDAAVILRERTEEIARDVSAENGKTLAEARGECGAAANFFEYYGGLGRAPHGSRLPDARPGVETVTRREPLGVVTLITPWNDPLATPARKLGPALLAGNAVVLKPAGETPLSAWHLARALDDAGAPAGILNVVTGPSSVVGPPLLLDERVRAVSFTGSNEVGRELSRQLAGRSTRLQAELGGKNAALVLEDADIDLAISTVTAAACAQAGQRCTATSRVIVADAIAREFVERLIERVGGLQVGAGNAEGTDVGPLVTDSHREFVESAISRAVDDGARLAVGGRRPEGAALARGHFLTPAVLTGVKTDTALWREEIFAAVIAVATVGTFDEGLALVNDSPFGLSASLFTRDLAAAQRFAGEVDTGQVAVNLPTAGWDAHIPFGGFGESGSPFKEHGLEGLAFYTRVKSVAMRAQ